MDRNQLDDGRAYSNPLPQERYCDPCHFLQVTESQQNSPGKHMGHCHYCLFFKEPVFHKGHHPRLPRLGECLKVTEGRRIKP